MPESSEPVRVITGPTAVGKTAIGIELAEHIGGEIVSADSRQVYRELTIGSAKPTADELSRVPHHFINELRLGEHFSAGMFARQAQQRIADIRGRGRAPIVVGGATLYLHALIHGLSPSVPADSAVRAALEARLETDGPENLYRELLRVDPRAASTMDATKTRRLIRALEVYQIAGIPLSDYHDQVQDSPCRFKVIVLMQERKKLYTRINERVDQMLETGLMDEVGAIAAAGLDPNLPALRTIGYREPLEYLAGQISKPRMIELIKRNSRNYAKRQLTWFRRYPNYQWAEPSHVR